MRRLERTEVLHLFRTWGWATGLRKLKLRIQDTGSDRQRAALQAYADWMAGDRNLYSEAIEQLKTLGGAERVHAGAGQPRLSALVEMAAHPLGGALAPQPPGQRHRR